MSPAVAFLPVPAGVPEFLSPRVEALCHTLRSGRYGEALAAAQTLSDELTESYGPLHNYTLHSLELVAFCAQVSGLPVMAADLSLYTAAAWQRLLAPTHHHIRRQAHSGAASWLTVTNASDAVRTGAALLDLLQSIYGKNHPSTPFVEHRLNAINSTDQETARNALRASGPALILKL